MSKGLWMSLMIGVSLFGLACQSGTGDGGQGDSSEPKNETQDAAPADKADAVADRVMDALGGQKAWDETRYVSWHFFGKRRHYWDRVTDDVRIESNDVVILMNLKTKVGQVVKGGEELVDEELVANYMERGYGWWTNDSYWMFMPFKLRDPGAELTYTGERKLDDGSRVDILTLTFADDTGLTPRNKYDISVSRQNDLIVSWDYYEDRDDPKPKMSTPWRGWETFGKIKLATDHGRGAQWNIQVHETLPESVFKSFDPVAT